VATAVGYVEEHATEADGAQAAGAEAVATAGTETAGTEIAGTETAGTGKWLGARCKGLQTLRVLPYIMAAIGKYFVGNLLRATMVMNISRQLDSLCAILFEILDQKVKHLAKELFNTHLERKGKYRAIYFDNGKRWMSVGPGNTLYIYTAEAIPEFFGPFISLGNSEIP
jgi:hypothetical protein